MYVCMRVQMWAYMYVCVCVCVYVYIPTYSCVLISVYIAYIRMDSEWRTSEYS